MTADNRIHARVRTEIPCTLWTDDGEERGILMDLSHGGALIQARRGAFKKGDAFELEIERHKAEPIAVMVEVLREEPLETTATYATRFSLIEPKQAGELQAMIDALTGPQEGGRLQRRVELRCDSADEFAALLSNLNAGNISLQTATALVLAEHVHVAVRIAESRDPLMLAGTVTHVRTVDAAYHVGIRFDPLNEDQRDAVSFYRKLFSL